MTDATSHHTSLWRDTYDRPQTYPALHGNVEVDVAIVGAGITGLTAATLLTQAGKRVAVLEAFNIGAGCTGYTTCHVTSQLDTDYKHLISDFGLDGATLARQSAEAAIQQIERLVGQLNVDCGFRRVPGYLYTETQKDVSYLEEELEASRKVGLEATLIRGGVPLPFPILAAIRAEGQAEFHPMPYLHALASAVQAGGGQVFEHTHVESLTEGEPCRLETGRGTVTAREVLLATHTPLGLSVLHTMVAPYRSYVIAIRAEGASAHAGLFWDTADPYHYTRSYTDERGELILIGGADHKTAHAPENDSFVELEQYARERYRVSSVDYRWSSQYYESSDGLPYIGKGWAGSHIHMATGFNGDGILYGTLAGRLLTDEVLGHANPWAELYTPRRFKPMSSATKFVVENLKVARDFVVDWLAWGQKAELSEIGVGQGRVVQLDGNKCAVYRDEMGQIHTLSAVCPHLKCIVHWNEAELSWDCPCHGSRFGALGEVLEGPSTSGLERLEVPGPKR